MKRISLFFLSLAFSCLSWADDLGPAAKAEIDHLLKFISSSTCDFNRNGAWYKASDAADHIQTKYDYLLKRDLVANAEQFIERAATKSSISGSLYKVKCEDGSELTSEAWLKAELVTFRSAK